MAYDPPTDWTEQIQRTLTRRVQSIIELAREGSTFAGEQDPALQAYNCGRMLAVLFRRERQAS